MNPLVWQIIVWAVTTAIAYLLAPKPDVPKPATIDDFDAPTATEDRAIPVVFGTVWITGPNVVWYGDLKTRERHAD